MTAILRAFSAIVVVLGGMAVIGVDAMATVWLANTHGLGWAVLAWITFVPLLFIPFLAGYGLAYVLAWGAMVVGHATAALADAIESEQEETDSWAL